MTKAKPKILLIDDDQFIRELLSDYLSENGYEIYEADDGDKGIKEFQRTQPDIVLLDLRMPKVDGLKVLELLYKNSPDTPIIIVSGQGTMDDVIKALRLGAWDYLIKPIQDFDLLKYSIDKVLERANLIKQNKENKKQLEELNQELEEKVKKRTELLKSAMQDLDTANSALKRQNIDSIKILSQIIEMRPGIYKGHSKFIAEKSVILAKELGCDEAQVQTIMIAGLLLQIGKMSLPDKMLTTPHYELNKFEEIDFLKHAIEGEKLLKGMSHLKDAAYIIRCQYEKYDGTGFPDGLKGEQIPIGARIIKVLQDFFTYHNGLTTGKKMNSVKQSFKKLVRYKNKDYDPDILDLYVLVATGQPYKTQKIIIETDWFKLQPGMHIVLVKYKDIVYIKDKIANKEIIQQIKELRETVGVGLIIQVQVR